MSEHVFQTEVNQLLNLIIHSLYSHKEIFLRELISNASDALDKLKYLTLSDDAYKSLAFNPQIDITLDEKAHTLVIRDNGIGMNEEELIHNLGTIARSGTKQFLNSLSGEAKKDSNLIGQFGVGFYSAFMVADKVEVISRKPLDERAYRWVSDGKGTYETSESSLDGWGTQITLYLNQEGHDYAKSWEIKSLVKKYSNHIAFPIFLHYIRIVYKDKTEKEEKVDEQINQANALWKRPKSELSDEDYKEFYKTLSGDWEDPLIWYHTKAEGTLEYTTLFYVPSKAPYDLYYSDYKPGVKLYVKRVFITDDDKELMPTYLRFLRGIIDSEDLPLNVSREILQQNKILLNIKNASVKKLLGEFESMANNNPELYNKFINEYNRPLKEGLYQDYANREQLIELVRFHSTKSEGWVSFKEYKERMKPDQKAIYLLSGGNLTTLKQSPLLEAYRAKDYEVLLLDQDIDEIILPTLDKYKDIEIKSINKLETAKEFNHDSGSDEGSKQFVEKLKSLLSDRVKDVVVSQRLVDSPSCLVTAEDEPTLQMQRMMKALGQETGSYKPILEVNLKHPILAALQNNPDENLLTDVAHILVDQAFLLEGTPPQDVGSFVSRLNRLIQGSLKT